MKINGREYSRRELEKRIGNIHQIGGTIHSTGSSGRSKGVGFIDFHTGSGLTFTVVPDRGLDIALCSFKGLNLVYLTPGGIANPAFYEPQGLGWLRTFFGGLVTTCGLTYFGHPGKDGEEELGLHGRYSTTPADSVCDRSGWVGDNYILEVTGTVEEASLFGDKIRLQRSISSSLGSKSLKILDRAENFGFQTSPFTILYHINAGFPLLDESSELFLTSVDIEPYTDPARKGIKDFHRFSAPVHDFVDQDFLHTMACDVTGHALACLINRKLNDGLGLCLKFHTENLPFLSEWKMTGECDYVVGIEPVNTKILGVLEGGDEIDRCIADIKGIVSSTRKNQ
jgi:hypothetical protein